MDNVDKFIRAMEKVTEGLEDLISIDIEKEELVQMFNDVLLKHPLAVRLERVVKELPESFEQGLGQPAQSSNEFQEQHNKNTESLNRFVNNG